MGKFEYTESLSYVMKNLDRFVETNFEPTDADIIIARQRTTGLAFTRFQVRFPVQAAPCDSASRTGSDVAFSFLDCPFFDSFSILTFLYYHRRIRIILCWLMWAARPLSAASGFMPSARSTTRLSSLSHSTISMLNQTVWREPNWKNPSLFGKTYAPAPHRRFVSFGFSVSFQASPRARERRGRRPPDYFFDIILDFAS